MGNYQPLWTDHGSDPLCLAAQIEFRPVPAQPVDKLVPQLGSVNFAVIFAFNDIEHDGLFWRQGAMRTGEIYFN